MAKIKKESLVDQIYQRLREDIITLKMPLGTRLNVNELQSRLEVSCTPIREAVNRLTQEGLVVYENNVGATVLTLDEHDVKEINELAYTLQSLAVRLSMKNGDREEMAAQISEQIRRYEVAKNAREEVKAVHELIAIFYHHCGSRRLDESMIAIQGQMLLLRYIYAECPGHNGHSDVFRKIYDGVVHSDEEAICKALWEYIEQTTPGLLAWLKENT